MRQRAAFLPINTVKQQNIEREADEPGPGRRYAVSTGPTAPPACQRNADAIKQRAEGASRPN